MNLFLNVKQKFRSRNTGTLIVTVLLTFLVFSLWQTVPTPNSKDRHNNSLKDERIDEMNVVGIVCGQDHYAEFLAMMKSAIVFQNFDSPKLHFIVITEYEMQKRFQQELKNWTSITHNTFTFEIRNVSSTNDGSQFKHNRYPLKCGMERIQLPNQLSHLNKVLYVDADILFLTPVSDIWSRFANMNSTQLCGAAMDDGNIENHLYKTSYRVPFYGITGVNSGVMLMDLKKMREKNWTAHVMNYAEIYKSKLLLVDQDAINAYFHYYPERMLLLSHRYNVHQFQIKELEGLCRDCVVHGVRIIHGVRRLFINTAEQDLKDPIYLIYQVFSRYVLGTDPYEHLLKPIMSAIQDRKRNYFSIRMMRIYLEHTDTFAFAFPAKTPNFD